MTTKENSGLGRHGQLRQRILLLAASWLCFSLGSWVHRLSLPRNSGHHTNEWIEVDPLDAFIAEELAPDVNHGVRGHIDAGARGRIRQILTASVHLIRIGSVHHASVDDHSYSGVVAEFCPLNFTEQKINHPDTSTLFEDVVKRSHCGRHNVLRADLADVARLARKFDALYGHSTSSNVPSILDLKGAIFHESRCGATLASKAMMAMNPTKNRVYVHPAPSEVAMNVCGEGYPKCSVTAAANLMKDVVYMMSRSNDEKEENVFFVFRPEATRTMETFRTAFPTTPWIFLYREPRTAMVSQGNKPAFTMERSAMVRAYVKKHKYDLEDITDTEMRAVQLATFCLSALRNFKDAEGLGLAVQYTPNLGDDLVTSIFPVHFHARVDREGEERIADIDVDGGYVDDGLPHDSARAAPLSAKDAARHFLEKPYDMLEGSIYNFEHCKHYARGRNVLRCKEKDGD